MTNMTPQQRTKHILDALKNLENRKAQAITPKADGSHLFQEDQEPEFKSHEWLERKTS